MWLQVREVQVCLEPGELQVREVREVQVREVREVCEVCGCSEQVRVACSSRECVWGHAMHGGL